MDTWLVSYVIDSDLRIEEEMSVGDVHFEQVSNDELMARVRVLASNPEEAQQQAIRKVNDSLDVLSCASDVRLAVSGVKSTKSLDSTTRAVHMSFSAHIVKICERDKFSEASRLLNELTRRDTTALRALGWYRKGLSGVDPFDKFLAYWNSIEILAEKYGPEITDERKIKPRIKEMLRRYCGDSDTSFVDEFYTYRNNIAHGAKPVNHDEITRISKKVPKLKDVAHQFLVSYIADKFPRNDS